jgi:DNA (cytosine-5)-methyltransferase 1
MASYFISHFSGIGGAAIGAKACGCILAGAVELLPEIAELYQRNLGDVFVGDIADISPRQFDVPSARQRRASGDLLILQASPPCQDYSRANVGKQTYVGDRANVLGQTFRHYEMLKPEYIILENVIEYRSAPVYLEFEAKLISMGYSILKVLLPASSMGVPQHRKRFYMVAWAEGYPQPDIRVTHQPSQIVGWGSVMQDILHTFRPSDLTQSQAKAIAFKGIYNGLHMLERIRYRKLPKIKALNEVGITITASMGDDYKGGTRNKVLDIWNADKKCLVSVPQRGLARLQTFPDSYEFSGNMRIDCRGIGNAVACKVSQTFIEQILENF